MQPHHIRQLSARRLLPLAIAATWCLVPTIAIADTIAVTSCDDETLTPGNLRNTIQSAVTGDTIDLSALTCPSNTIALSDQGGGGEGQLTISVATLKIVGPPNPPLTIDATNSGARVFNHTGTGTLTLQNLVIANAHQGAAGESPLVVRGGCIYSAGSVVLLSSKVTGCRANNPVPSGGSTYGGGLYVAQHLELHNSVVSNNGIYQANAGTARGGGIVAKGGMSAYYSTISSNYIYCPAAGSGTCSEAALLTSRSVSITSSTISNNSAYLGYIEAIGTMNFVGGPDYSLLIRNSTIANNGSSYSSSAILATGFGTVAIRNSTIAFNGGYGLKVGSAHGHPTTLTLSSNLIAQNGLDFASSDVPDVSGSNNLIESYSGTVPPDTVRACPHLGNLRANGGPTNTMALMSGSVGIDQGLNPEGYNNDQRGALGVGLRTYPRVSGPSADMGAYEVDQSDIIFNNDFETCVDQQV